MVQNTTDLSILFASDSCDPSIRDWAAPVFSPDARNILFGTTIWSRRRPEYWWGIAWLPEFWVALVAGMALLYLGCCGFSRRFQSLE